MVDVYIFFSEVNNVQDKALNLLVFYFICVCYPKQKRVLKEKFKIFFKKSLFFKGLFLDFKIVIKVESLLNNFKDFSLVCFHLDMTTSCDKA